MIRMEWRHRLLGSAQGMINLLDGIHYPKEGAPQAHNYYVKIVPTVCGPGSSCNATPHPKSGGSSPLGGLRVALCHLGQSLV
jgi:hypothetical protein